MFLFRLFLTFLQVDEWGEFCPLDFQQNPPPFLLLPLMKIIFTLSYMRNWNSNPADTSAFVEEKAKLKQKNDTKLEASSILKEREREREREECF